MWHITRAASAGWRGAFALRTAHAQRALSGSALRQAVSEMTMPAMSPTMDKGNIGEWKVDVGDTFAAGDVLLDVETDKAMMDVEAQDDGVLGKIIVPSGAKDVPVGRLIAFLAEEGDDLSGLDARAESEGTSGDAGDASPAPPAEEKKATDKAPSSSSASPSATDSVTFTRPAPPSVHRLAHQYGISDPSAIKGTGLHGMLTKGDVLAFLGKTETPFGSAKPPHTKMSDLALPRSDGAGRKEKSDQLLSAAEERALLLDGLARLTRGAHAEPRVPEPVSLDDIYAGYGARGGHAPATAADTRAPQSQRSPLADIYRTLLE
ncbi:dihydrolipoyllysine-residue acetyltransferase [Malassezia sp. CBS 17886]|nr:dihydrolipoyllysine-residue acetyltransferase [Malassezia sp. CBS 17886]